MVVLSSKRPSQSQEKKQQLLKQVTGKGEKLSRLNINIEESLYRDIKTTAAQEGRTISAITKELWIEYLSK